MTPTFGNPPARGLTCIAFVVSQIRSTGPIFVVRDIVAGLQKTGGYRILIIELRPGDHTQPLRAELSSLGCTLHSLNASLLRLEVCTASVAKQLGKLLKQQKVQVVHSHTYHPDLVCSRLKGFTLLTTQHNLSGEDFVLSKGKLLGHRMHRRLLGALRQMQAVVGITQTVLSYYRERLGKDFPGGNCHKLGADCPTTPGGQSARPAHQSPSSGVVIPNGVDTERFYPAGEEEKRQLRRQLDLPQETFIVVSVGMLTRGKDPLTLLQAVEHLRSNGALNPRFLLLLLGDGPLRADCKAYTDAHRLGAHVRLLGFQLRPEEFLRAADGAVSASLSEGFGLNVAEFLSCGLPTATTAIAPFNELLALTPSMQSLRFSPGNVAECARALALLPNAVLPGAERDAFAHRYSTAQMARAYHLLYQSLTAEP